jgi:hypothetical protein
MAIKFVDLPPPTAPKPGRKEARPADAKAPSTAEAPAVLPPIPAAAPAPKRRARPPQAAPASAAKPAVTPKEKQAPTPAAGKGTKGGAKRKPLHP